MPIQNWWDLLIGISALRTPCLGNFLERGKGRDPFKPGPRCLYFLHFGDLTRPETGSRYGLPWRGLELTDRRAPSPVNQGDEMRGKGRRSSRTLQPPSSFPCTPLPRDRPPGLPRVLAAREAGRQRIVAHSMEWFSSRFEMGKNSRGSRFSRKPLVVRRGWKQHDHIPTCSRYIPKYLRRYACLGK